MANLLTLLRILLVPVIINLIIYGYNQYALSVIIFASITDWLDGKIARIKNEETQLGKFLDPLADKLLITVSFATLGAQQSIPLWIVIVIISRDFILVAGSLVLYMSHDLTDITPTKLGKAAAFSQYFYLVSFLFSDVIKHQVFWMPYLLWLLILLTISSELHYINRGLKILNGKEKKRNSNMKKVLNAILLVITGMLLISVPASAGFLNTGDSAPNFKLSSISGKDISLSDFKGKEFVIIGMFHICDPCRMQSAELQKVKKQFEGKNVTVIGINTAGNNKNDVVNFLNSVEGGADFPFLLDPQRKIEEDYSVRVTPTVYIISKEGKIIFKSAFVKSDLLIKTISEQL